jgi:hypothetical protein
VKHPNQDIQKNQEQFLNSCPAEEKEFHSRLFRIGNAAYCYYQLAGSDEIPEEYFTEWLDGLPEPIRLDMKKKGFAACKSILPFTRYVNERRDVGMNEWMRGNLSNEDYHAWNK